MSPDSTVGTRWCFGADGAADLADAFHQFLGSLEYRPQLLGFGEPTHGVAEFLRLRNEAFRHLVEREGYRSIAIESDCLAALTVDAYVTEGEGSLDDAMETGFSHGFGGLTENRELVAWMREYNGGHDAAEKVRFYGFDAPTEVTGAASPRQALTALHGYLASNLEPAFLPCASETIDRLVGDDGRWTNPEAAMDPSKSVGASQEATQLRLLTDDLVAALTSQSPWLVDATSYEDWRRACLHGRTAAGLLRYHARMADGSGSRAAQLSRLMCQRDAMMAENLQAIAAQEARRGATLVFAQNLHLQKHRSQWLLPAGWGPLEGETLSWWSAGALAAQMGSQYAFLAAALGSTAEKGLDAPEPGTLEGALYAATEGPCIFDSRRLAEALRGVGSELILRTDTSTDHGYFALDPDHLDGTDGVLFVRDVPAAPVGERPPAS